MSPPARSPDDKAKQPSFDTSPKDGPEGGKSAVMPDPALVSDLLGAFFAPDFESSLAKILSLSQRLTGAEISAFYQLSSTSNPSRSSSEYKLVAANEPYTWLPSSLPTAEMNSLLSSSGTRLPGNHHLWVSGQAPASNFHRSISDQKLSYLLLRAISGDPLTGNPRYPAFLQLLGSQNNPPVNDLLQRSQTLASVLQTLRFWFTQQSELATKSHELKKIEAIELMLQEHSREGILLADPTLHILQINHAAESILGFYSHEVSGHLLQNVLVGSETLWSEMDQLLTNQSPVVINDVRLYRRSGDSFLANIHAHPVIVADQIHQVVIMLHDLTEEELIRERNRQLEQRAILGEVTAIFAHEVRNPINNISTGLELISYNLAPDDPNQAIISRLIQDCDRLGELMRSVLSFARPMEFTMTSLPVEPFLTRLMERAQNKLERHQIAGTVQVEPGCPNILGSPRALEQVIVNLMNNAIQAMGDTGGQLVLRARPAQTEGASTSLTDPDQRPAKSFVEISVVDTGPGIPKELLERIFQPFFTTNTGGTGLGLAICKRIVTAHRGNIQVESFPGGTVFRIFIPVAIFD